MVTARFGACWSAPQRTLFSAVPTDPWWWSLHGPESQRNRPEATAVHDPARKGALVTDPLLHDGPRGTEPGPCPAAPPGTGQVGDSPDGATRRPPAGPARHRGHRRHRIRRRQRDARGHGGQRRHRGPPARPRRRGGGRPDRPGPAQPDRAHDQPLGGGDSTGQRPDPLQRHPGHAAGGDPGCRRVPRRPLRRGPRAQRRNRNPPGTAGEAHPRRVGGGVGSPGPRGPIGSRAGGGCRRVGAR